ncbi:MAG: endonuclease domain-containing protein [Actinomycetota bacterium]|nr:endonuclease domain-containing protein [Actinomycetota bacterium]
MRTPAELPEPLRGRSFMLSEADALGVARRRTRDPQLVTASRGIRVPWGVDQELVDRLRPVLALTPDGVASHCTAAVLWRIPLPRALQRAFELHITRPAGHCRTQRRGIVGHSATLGLGDVRVIRGIRVTSPLRTWLDLADILDLDDLIAAGDHLVCEHYRIFQQPRLPLVPLPELAAAVLAETRRRGIRLARAATEEIRVGADSVPETKMRLALVRAGLPQSTLNFVVKDATGQHISWPDLAHPEFKVAVEYDGAHHRSPRQKEIDDGRDHQMAQLGWRQVRISSGLIAAFGDTATVQRVTEALTARGWRP